MSSVLDVERSLAPRMGTRAPGLLSADDIGRQVGVIARSGQFRRSHLLKRMLRFVVQESLHGRGDELDATTIARRAFGKNEAFRSSKDSSVRVAANRLRTALQLYYASDGSLDDIVIKMEPGSYRPAIALRPDNKTPMEIARAVQLWRMYQSILTPKTNAIAHAALRDALASWPEHPQLLTCFFDTCNDAYKFQFNTIENPLEEGDWVIQRAMEIAPGHPSVQFQYALFALAHRDFAKMAELGRKLIDASPDDPELVSRGAFILTHTMDPVVAAQTFELSPSESSDHSGWRNHAMFLAMYHKGDYEKALEVALNMGLPQFFWGPLERAAALAQLGILDAAKQQLSRALALNPHFAKDPRWPLSQHIPHEDVLEHLLEGLRKAGLQPSPAKP